MAIINRKQATTESPLSDDSAHQLHLGFERVQQEVEAQAKTDLEPINLDVAGVVQTVLGTIPEVLPLRAELAKIGAFELGNVDKLRDYALALGHTHSKMRIANGTPDTSLIKELVAAREEFHAQATVLVHRGILDAARVGSLKSGNSRQGLAYDVIGLCDLFLAAWDQFGDRSLLEKAEVEGARLAANRLLTLLGTREQGPSANADASLLRQKAFTRVVRAYNEVRAAIAFVRRKEGDVDEVTPSLYARRRRPGGSDEAPAAEPLVEPQGTGESDSFEAELSEGETLNAAVAQAFAPAAPRPGAAASGAASGAVNPTASEAERIPAGFPGARPLSDA